MIKQPKQKRLFERKIKVSFCFLPAMDPLTHIIYCFEKVYKVYTFIRVKPNKYKWVLTQVSKDLPNSVYTRRNDETSVEFGKKIKSLCSNISPEQPTYNLSLKYCGNNFEEEYKKWNQ